MNLPDGYYINVRVVDVTNANVLLDGGTGTVLNGALGCGSFEANSRPHMEGHYNITGNYSDTGAAFNAQNVRCIHVGRTSEFR